MAGLGIERGEPSSSAVAVNEPADVPTTSSASRLSKPVCSAIAAMTPLWKVALAPPALKTIPIETMGKATDMASL